MSRSAARSAEERYRLAAALRQPPGNSWMLTNEHGRRMQAQLGLDFYAQFGALDGIAERSIELVREYAR